jgi:hypothetical protein
LFLFLGRWAGKDNKIASRLPLFFWVPAGVIDAL